MEVSMSAMAENSQAFMRQFFKYFNHLMLLNWRLGLGPYLSFWPGGLGRYLVLTHIGRKSGLRRRTPVNYAQISGDIYVTAGFGKESHWYKNIIANPHIEVWLPDGWWQAEAEDITGTEGSLTLLREVIKGSGFAGYLAGVNPHNMSDEALAAVTSSYRLLRIRRTTPCTGKGGPGDLVWVWPLMLVAMLPLVLRGRYKHA
jgi:deazaflavin-dependent oxidoreductase (nitroreductase family)